MKYEGHMVFLFQCLHFLHTHKVIHRDLKAGNLLLTSDGNIKLGMLCLRVIILLPLHTGKNLKMISLKNVQTENQVDPAE